MIVNRFDNIEERNSPNAQVKSVVTIEGLRSYKDITFEKGEKLGGGNFATVYRIREIVADGKKFAVDFALKLAEPNEKAVEEIESEIHFIQALHQKMTPEEREKIFPNVHKVTYQGQIGYLTERFEGDLLSHLKSENKSDFAAQLIEQMALFSKYGVIYSDIKPENVLVNKVKAVFSDFGDCRFANEKKESALSLTHSPKYVYVMDTQLIDDWASMDEKTLTDSSNEHQARALGLIITSLFKEEEIPFEDYYGKNELEEYIENSAPLLSNALRPIVTEMLEGQLTPIQAWERFRK